MPRRPCSEDGFAVLSAIVGLAILLLLVSSMIVLSGAGVRRSALDLKRSQAKAFSDAIVAQTALSLQDTRQSMRPRVDGVPSIIHVLGITTTIKVEDEFGKVDLNAAPSETLSRLFQSAGLTASEADKLGIEIRSWTQPQASDQNPANPNGAESAPRLFKCVSEVLLVPDVTPALLRVVEPALTVYSGSDQIDRAVAPYETLLALSGITAEDARAIIEDRINGQVTPPPLALVREGRIVQGINQFGWPFRIRSTFVFDGRSYDLDATIRLSGSWAPGYVLAETHFGGGR